MAGNGEEGIRRSRNGVGSAILSGSMPPARCGPVPPLGVE